MPAPSSVTDASLPQHKSTGIPKWIRIFRHPGHHRLDRAGGRAQRDSAAAGVVGQMRSVSMSAQTAPSVIAMKRVGQVFDEFKSDSAVMIVLRARTSSTRGAPLLQRHGRSAEADTKHVEHVQDFWGDPHRSRGAKS